MMETKYYDLVLKWAPISSYQLKNGRSEELKSVNCN